MPSYKRSPGDSQVTRKKLKLAGEWQALAEDEERMGISTDVAAIVQYLMQHPEETKKAKTAILGGMLAKSAGKSMDESFNSTYIYLSRVPKTHLMKLTLPSLDTRLTEETLLKLAKVDKDIPLKILSFSTGTLPNQKIMSHDKKTFDSLVKDRAAEVNNVVASLEWDAQYKIDWTTCGVYTLLPQKPVDTPAAEHIYTKVNCKFLEGDAAEAPASSQLLILAS